MNVKKIMAGILSAAIAFTSVAFTAFADDSNTITYGEFLTTMKDNNYNYDFGGKTITLKMTKFCVNQNHNHAEEGFEDYSNKKDEAPARIQAPKAQYQLFKDVQDVVIKNLNIVADIKDGVALHLFNNNGWEGKIEAGTPFNAEFQFLNSGNLTIEGCNFDRVSVAPYHSGDRNKLENYTDTIKGCSFKNVYNAYGVQGAYAGKVIVDNSSFDTCSGGMYVEGGKNGITMSNNNFTNMGKYCASGKEDTRGLIQISANVELTGNAVVEITNNTSDGSTPVLRQLSPKISEIVTDGNKFGSDTKATSTSDSLVYTEKPSQAATAAKIGDKEYATLADAIADAKSGDTIVLLDNIKFTDTFTINTLNKITIDFNDKTIDVTEVNEGKDSIVIKSGADVTFTGNGGISANKSCIANYGAKLTLNGGTYTTQHKSRGTAIFNTDNATVELNAGAKIHSTNYGVYVGGNVNCVMNGAEIISSSYQGQSGIQDKVDYFYAVRNEGNLTINDGTVIKGIQGALACLNDTVINGGTFETYETEESKGKSFYPVYIADQTKVVIKGGKFHSYARAAVCVSDNDIGTDGATAEIEGGVFTSGKAVNVIDATPGTNSAISVSGGTFGSDVSAYAKPGFSASKKEDGSYTVGKSEIAWETMTDSGVYTVNADNFGLMRFSFKTNVDAASISKIGIKFMNAKDITAETKSATISADNNANNFYGDLTEIAPTAGTKYFATAYMVMGDTTVWSDVIECSLNVKKQFTNYGGNQ